MFKKLLIASTVLAITSNVALAHKAHHHHAHHSRSHAQSDFKGEKMSAVAPATTEAAPVISSDAGVPYVGVAIGGEQSSSYKGLVGDIFAGYGKTVAQHYYLGGEVFADVVSTAISGSQNGNRTMYAVGASFIPGIKLNSSTMAFGRIGVKASRYHASNTHTDGQLGLGLESDVTNHVAVRGEYVYTGGGVIHNFTNSGSNGVELGLVYKLS